MTASAPTFVTDAVVLRLSNYGEADRVVTLLTAARGKISALAPGARRSTRRFGAALGLFGHGEATLRERPGQELFLLEGLYGERGFPRLSQELSRLSHASYACELCRELCPPHEPEPAVLRLLLDLLGHLDALPLAERPRAEALRVFELQLLQAVGLGLQLVRCAACGGEVPGEAAVAFDLQRGGVVCATCRLDTRAAGADAQPLPQPVRAALLALHGLPLAGPDLGDLHLPPGVAHACRDLLLSVMRHHLGHTPRAVEFIAKLNMTHP